MFFKTQTAADLRRTELHKAEMALVEHQARFDYYEATVVMLKKRVARLRHEVSAGSAGSAETELVARNG